MAGSQKRGLPDAGVIFDRQVRLPFWECAVAHRDDMPLHKYFREVDAATQRQLATFADKIVVKTPRHRTFVPCKDIAGMEFMWVHDCRLYQSMDSLNDDYIIFRHVLTVSTIFVISASRRATEDESDESVAVFIVSEDGRTSIGSETFHCTDRMSFVHIRINAMLVDNNIMTRQTYVELKGNFAGNAYIGTATAANAASVWPYRLRSYWSNNCQKRIKVALKHRAG